MKKNKIPTDKEQRIVADILTEFMFCKDMEEIWKTWNSIYNRYNLCDDPFTHTPCSCKEAEEFELEYEKQLQERYFII